ASRGNTAIAKIAARARYFVNMASSGRFQFDSVLPVAIAWQALLARCSARCARSARSEAAGARFEKKLRLCRAGARNAGSVGNGLTFEFSGGCRASHDSTEDRRSGWLNEGRGAFFRGVPLIR